MSITEFTKDMNIIAALDDEPNDVGGLSAAQLKAKFDEGGLAVQEYLNGTLIPDTREYVLEQVRDVVLGQIPDGTITLPKLAETLRKAMVRSWRRTFVAGDWTFASWTYTAAEALPAGTYHFTVKGQNKKLVLTASMPTGTRFEMNDADRRLNQIVVTSAGVSQTMPVTSGSSGTALPGRERYEMTLTRTEHGLDVKSELCQCRIRLKNGTSYADGAWAARAAYALCDAATGEIVIAAPGAFAGDLLLTV